MSDDEFIKNFVNDVLLNKKNIKKNKKHRSKKKDSMFDIQDYTQPIISGKTKQEIAELQKIAESIEQNTLKDEGRTLPENLKIDYKGELNNAQYLAVTTTEGALLVIAGAGSGKTRTIVYRVSYLIETGVSPQNILLLTFTRKASSEMIDRTVKLLNSMKAQNIMGGTFHSFANFVLRRYSKLLGLNPKFTIIDTVDATDTIGLIRKELKLEKKEKAFPRSKTIHKLISLARNTNRDLKSVIVNEESYDYLYEYTEELVKIGKIYKEYKKSSNTLDYDDLLEYLRDYLTINEEFREKLQEQYKYIMVDEFQDTNLIQKEIIDLLADKHKNIMVVGDDTQSIYSFRGANFENILKFPQTFPECKVVKLEENYRSHQTLLDLTNSIIDNVKLGYKKHLFSSKNYTSVPKPIISRLYSQSDEAEYITETLLSLREQDIELNQIAVLFRASFHKNHIEAELIKRNIPYVVYGGIKFIERRHIKDIIAYLRLILNPFDNVSWHRVLKLISGIGDATVRNILDKVDFEKGLNFDNFKKRKYYDELKRFEDTYKAASDNTIPIKRKIKMLKDYYKPLLKNIEADYKNRIRDVDFLETLAAKYDDLEKLLTDIALEPPSNRFQQDNMPVAGNLDEKPLILSTIHSSKGLEWHTVFVPHLIEGMFPNPNTVEDIRKLEEERRLFYVACTRAKEQLYLTFPSYVASYSGFYSKPSRFLAELDESRYELSIE